MCADVSHPLQLAGARGDLVHAPGALLLARFRYLAVKICRGGAGAGAEGENVCVGKTHFLDETQPLFKVGVSFPRETDDQIGCNDQIGDGCAGVGDQLAETGNGAAPGHAAQLGVGAGLQRQVQVRAQPFRPTLPQVKEAVGQLPWLEAAEAEAGNVGIGEDGGSQLFEIGTGAAGQIPSVGAEVDAGKNGFAVAVFHKLLNFAHDICGRTAAAVAAQCGYDAECAAVLAAVLDLDKGACTASIFASGCGREGCSVRLNAGEIVGIGELRAPGFQ